MKVHTLVEMTILVLKARAESESIKTGEPSRVLIRYIDGADSLIHSDTVAVNDIVVVPQGIMIEDQRLLKQYEILSIGEFLL